MSYFDYVTDYQFVLELMNGIWTLLTVQIIVVLVLYIIRRVLEPPHEPQWIFVRPEPWHQELGVQLAFSWILYSIGTGTARSWAYLYRECANRLDNPAVNCAHVTDNVEWLFIASIFAVVGGVYTIRVMLPRYLGIWRWAVPLILSVVPPTAWHLYAHWHEIVVLQF